ncbi:unnamed protein product [Cylicocyclus nassatus]|uniref:Uncharacterized protein n=1 Tax=Cylicocyclus nassatus TaxID=53992 RepID=A0AA36HBE6_CYLNA|nr:unnamed protein product [Cylicocyclus nassatus]
MMDKVLKEEETAASRENCSAEPVRMVFEMDRSLDRRRYNAPTCNEVAVVYVGEDGDVPAHREFAVHPYGNAVQKISDISNLAHPLCYPTWLFMSAPNVPLFDFSPNSSTPLVLHIEQVWLIFGQLPKVILYPANHPREDSKEQHKDSDVWEPRPSAKSY